ncbi:MAG TPA: hypothetical protein VHN79_04915 [Lacunisphaera sp.]|nr:hypothetical protein [Lacunisphaera sp.]
MNFSRHSLAVLALCSLTCAAVAVPIKKKGPPIEIDLATSLYIANNVPWGAYTNDMLTSPLKYWVDRIPPGNFTYMPTSGPEGHIYGHLTASTVGAGVSLQITNRVVSMSSNAISYGIAWSYELLQVDGKGAVVLRVKINAPGKTGNHDIFVTPEMLGISPYDAAWGVLTGSYNERTMNALLESSALGNGAGNRWITEYRKWIVSLGDTQFLD